MSAVIKLCAAVVRQQAGRDDAEAEAWRLSALGAREEYDQLRRERDAQWADLERIASLCGRTADEHPLQAVARVVRERDEARAALEETEHQMHLRIRAGYDKTIADSWRKKVEEVEDQRNANARKIDKLRAERRQLRARLVECRPWVGVCPFPNTPGFSEMIAIRDLADDTLEEVKP